MPTYSWSNLKPKLDKEPSRGVSRLTHQIDLVLVPWPKSFTRQHIFNLLFLCFFLMNLCQNYYNLSKTHIFFFLYI
jgi:hypothetical protein